MIKPNNKLTLYSAVTLTTVGDHISFSGITYIFFERDNLLQLSLIQSLSSLSLIISMPFLGRLADRYPLKYLFILCNILLCAISLKMAFSTINYIMILFILKNVILEVSRCSQEKLLPLLVTSNELAKSSAQLSLLERLSTIIGIIIGPFIAHYYSTIVFLVDGLSFLICTALYSQLSLQANIPSTNLTDIQRCSFIDIPGLKSIFTKRILNNKNITIFIIFFICHFGWGMKDVLGIKLLEQHYAILPMYFGIYSSTAYLAELIFASISSCYLGKILFFSRKQVFIWAGLLALSFIANDLSNGQTYCFIVKFIEGCASVMTGLICGYFLVLKSPDSIRGTISGTVGSSASLGLIIGKMTSGILEKYIMAEYIYTIFGIVIIASLAFSFSFIRSHYRRAISLP